VLVCWDPTSRASWDSLRAWVSAAATHASAKRWCLQMTLLGGAFCM
jgi:hypothetical protein